MASNITLQDLITSARAYPELTPVLGASGWAQQPALSIANDTMQIFLAQNFDWKFNRQYVNPFLTVALQQDYIGVSPLRGNTSILDMGWLEQGTRLDVNNSSIPQPIFSLETVRDLGKTAYQANPFNISWIPVPLASYAPWQSNTSYPSGLGQAQTPVSPVQQFVDINGNFLYVSTNGTSGTVQPVLPIGAPPGDTVVDGTVTWTVADPNGIAIRLSPLPATSGIVWQICAIYQKKPPILTSLQNTISPIPDEYGYLFRQGFIALCMQHAGSKQFAAMFAQWQQDLTTALKAADRERDDASFYPSESIMGGGNQWRFGAPIGPGWPFSWYGY